MSRELEPSAGDVLHVKTRHDDTEATIFLGGEFDMAGVARFWGFVSEALAAHPRPIIVDGSGLEFIDSSGLLALLRAWDAAVDAGVTFAIRHPSTALRRIVELAGVMELLAPE